MKKPHFLELSLGVISLALTCTASAKISTNLGEVAKQFSFSLRDSQGEEKIRYNSDLALAPASTAKVISTACSLQQLGPAFQFSTDFSYKGILKGDTLAGDLVIRGHGDPSFVTEDLNEVVSNLRYAHGLRKITGKIIFDLSYFGKEHLKIADGFEGDEGRSFATDITAASVNQNSFSFWITADQHSTHAALIPALVLDLKIKNDTHVGESTAVSVSYDPNSPEARLSGSVETGGEKAIYRSVSDPYDYYSRLFHQLWQQSGGEWIDSSPQLSLSPVSATLLHTHQSRPLARVLMEVNKLSLNLGAEQIFLAAGSLGGSASYEKSQTLLQGCLKRWSLSDQDVHLTNASGLSREAKVKTSAMTQVLSKMREHFVAPEYLSSLSISGVDGTTKSRLADLTGQLRVKTGSIQNVRAIAGYYYPKTGGTYTFALILNGLKAADGQVKAAEDQFLRQAFAEAVAKQ